MARCCRNVNSFNSTIQRRYKTPNPQSPTVLWNGMIHPFINLTIHGVVWYQGEQNTYAPDTYNCTFPAMIADWRKKWYEGTRKQTDENFYFGFMQIGPGSTFYANSKNVTRGYPDIRWHQTKDVGFTPNYDMTNVFMGVSVDLTDDHAPDAGVHYRDKLTSSSRLALSGLAVAYGRKHNFQGPQVSGYDFDEEKALLTLKFDDRQQTIQVRNKDGFELCCSSDPSKLCVLDSNKWTAVPILDYDSTSVTLSCKACINKYVRGVRYIWRETPCEYKKCAVYSSQNQLPAPPFVTFAVLSTKKISLEKINGGNSKSISFASYYGSHMVLQQQPSKTMVWGHAASSLIGQSLKITVSDDHGYIKNYEDTIKAGPGNLTTWGCQLEPMSAGGPYVISASVVNEEREEIQITDVMFGDVWLCSGQSNMEFIVPEMFNATQEYEKANHLPEIRLFTAAREESPAPLYDLKSVFQNWSVASNESLNGRLTGRTYFSAVCWVFGRIMYEHLGYPIGLIASNWGGTPVEAWSSPAALKTCNIELQPKSVHSDLSTEDFDVDGLSDSHDHSVLWNAMIHPFLNMTIYGALWYQGEANAASPDTYNCTFPAMISDWRKQWFSSTHKQSAQNFPFGFVQLGPGDHVYAEGKNIVHGFPDIRWHQTKDLGFVPNYDMVNVFMGTAIDLTDDTAPRGPIHPRDKLSTGERLALAGLAVAYKQTHIQYHGPTVQGFEVLKKDHSLILMFDTRIEIRSKEGFEICCGNMSSQNLQSQDWKAAPIVSSDEYAVSLSVTCAALQDIVGLRYIWRETPCPYKKCAVYSSSSKLPLTPFLVSGPLDFV